MLYVWSRCSSDAAAMPGGEREGGDASPCAKPLRPDANIG